MHSHCEMPAPGCLLLDMSASLSNICVALAKHKTFSHPVDRARGEGEELQPKLSCNLSGMRAHALIMEECTFLCCSRCCCSCYALAIILNTFRIDFWLGKHYSPRGSNLPPSHTPLLDVIVDWRCDPYLCIYFVDTFALKSSRANATLLPPQNVAQVWFLSLLPPPSPI